MFDHRHQPPTVTRPVALFISASFAVAYVAPFYLVPGLRISRQVSRNSPQSIRARSHAVFVTCLLCFAVTIAVHVVGGGSSVSDVLRRLGLYPVHGPDVFRSMLLLCILFAGPLFEQGVVDGNWRYWFRWSVVRSEVVDDWVGWRTYVVGPVSEEIIFRSFAVSLLLLAQTLPAKIVVEGPLLFGIAHLHHLNEFISTSRHPSQSYLSAVLTPRIIVPGLLRTVFQLGFTSLFGMIATFILLRTGNIYSCIAAHTFCNWMGLPRVWGRLTGPEQYDQQSVTKKSDDGGPRLGLQWTVAYYILLVAGAFSFWKSLYPLTASEHALTTI